MSFNRYNKTYFEVINERYSCRKFLAEKIKTEEIQLILEAARLAPTAVNYQPQRIIVVENPVLLEKLNEATKYLFDSKTVFVVCYDKEVSWHRRYDDKDHGEIDATIVATHMMLAATAMDIGCCYVCSFKEDIVRSILGLPDNYVISCMLPMGYPKEEGSHNSRNDIEDFVVYK